MASPVTTYAAVLEERRPDGDPKPWPTVLVLAVLWLLTINQLRVEWSINPQYTYGWTVPFLALYLFAERWKFRPRTGPTPFAGWVAAVVVVVAATLFPLRLIQEAAPDWRLVNWAMALVAASISLCAIYRAGGRPWLLHFAVPVLFVLVAVPWPMPLEKIFVQGLMRLVARVCVEALSFFAIPAVQHGNVIEISTGKVGVEEACSGVRSLQTTLMASLFLGELFRLSAIRRSFLLVGGLGLAFLCNLGRSFYLVWISAHEGPAAALKVHDTVGITILVVSLLGLAVLCALLRPRGEVEEKTDSSDRDAAPWRPRFASRSAIIAGAAWLLVVEAGTEMWYRSHEGGRTSASWSVRWPTAEPKFRDIPLSDEVRAMLRYDEGKSAAWKDVQGRQWSMIFLRWLPGRSSMQLARAHGPELCLAAAGLVLRDDLGVKNMRVAGLDLPMHSYVFTVGNTPLYVFFCLWQDLPLEDGPESTRQAMTMQSRLRDALRGRRNTGQQQLEIALAGAANPAEAEAAALRTIEGLITQ